MRGAMLSLLAVAACSDSAAVEAPLKLTPLFIRFSDVPVGSVVRRSVTLENTGAVAIEIERVVVGGLLADELRLVGVPERIPGGALRVVSLAYAPRSAGVRRDRVRFELGGGRSVNLDVSASASGEQLRITPERLELGPVALGSERTAPVILDLVGASPLDLSTATIRGDPGFEVRAGFPQQVQPGESAQILVTFRPTEVGEARAQVLFGAGARVFGPLTVTGAGVEAEIVLDPPHADVGTALIGDRKPHRIRLVSRARERHQVAIEVRGAVEAFTGLEALSATTTLEAGEGRDIDLALVPQRVGTASITLHARIDGGASRVVGVIEGAGLADPATPLALDPAVIELGVLEIGYPVERTVWLENTSEVPHEIAGAVRVTPTAAPVEVFPARPLPRPMRAHDRHPMVLRVTPAVGGPTTVRLDAFGASAVLRFEGVPRPVDTIAAPSVVDLGVLVGDPTVDRRAIELESVGRLAASVTASISGPSAAFLTVGSPPDVAGGGRAWLRLDGPPVIGPDAALDATLHLWTADGVRAVRLRGELRTPGPDGEVAVCVIAEAPGVELHVIPADATLRDVPFAGSRCAPSVRMGTDTAWSVSAPGDRETCARRLISAPGDVLLVVTTPPDLRAPVTARVEVRGLIPLGARAMGPGKRWDVAWIRAFSVDPIDEPLSDDSGRCQ